MKIYLIRHGRTTGDVEDRYGGDFDDHLTDGGIRQSKELSEKLTDKGIEIIFCSPKIRAQETAKYLKEILKVDAETVSDLRERNQYGVLTGMVKSEAKTKHPESVDQLQDYKNSIIGAETYEDFMERIKSVFNQILESSYDTVAVVTHGGPIRVIFREILGKGEIDVSDCAFAVIKSDRTNLSIESLNGITQK